VAYNARLPSGLEPPAVLHGGAGGGGGVESAQVGEKAQEKHLVHRGIGFGLQITEVRSRLGYLQWLGRGHHLSSVFSAHFLMSDNNCYRTLEPRKWIQSVAFPIPL